MARITGVTTKSTKV